MRKFAVLSIIVAGLAVSACTGDSSPKVKSLQKRDKALTCKEVLLEMNEAEFYRSMAEKNKGPKLKNVLMPLGYISTYMNAQEAIDSANARVDYLDRIYQIMACDTDAAPSRTRYTTPGGEKGLGAGQEIEEDAGEEIHYRHEHMQGNIQ